MKRFFLLMLTVLLCAGLFAGGQQGSTSTDGLTTVRVWGHNKQYHLTGASFTLSDWDSRAIPSRLWDKFVQEMANIGVRLDLTLIMEDQMTTAWQTLVASGQIHNYDWVSPINFNDTRARYNLVTQGMLLPMDTAIEQHSNGTARNYFNNTPVGQRIKRLSTLDDGHMYWLSQTDAFYYGNPNNIAGEPLGAAIRMDWLWQLNIPKPTTLDELFNTLRTFQDRDVNGNGLRDEVAMINVATGQWPQAFSGFFGIGDGNMAYIVGDRVLSQWYHPRARDFITYLQRLYAADLLKITVEGNEQAANRVGFFGSYWQDTYNDQQVIVPPGRPNAYTAPVVIQAFADTPVIIAEQPGVNQYLGSGMYSIPARSRNVEAVVRMIDFFHTPEHTTLGEWGIEGYTFRINPDGTWERFQVNESNVGVDMFMTAMAEALPFACWQAPFPRMRRGDKHDILQSLIDAGRARGYPQGFDIKNDYLREFYENRRWPSYISEGNINGSTAFPTPDEAERQSRLLPDLQTYSAELMTALIMGERSLNNWDSYMADFRRLGLDELLSIYQARLNRMR